MSMDTAELVSEWDSVPFDGGYEGLRALRDQEFSGAVVSGSARLFMLNGTVVGILDGDLDTFEEAAGTARQAPHEALPLLVVMQAQADEPRAQYYTQDTPISEVDRTLSDGKFTGYVELSENVLSGDYYLVYHQGRQMSVAWVGSSRKLITDEEAFEQADDEVGIYDVMQADIEPVELPEPETGGAVATPSDSEPSPTADSATEPVDGPTDGSSTPEPPAESTDDDAGQREERARGTPSSSSSSSSSSSPSGPPGSKAAGASQGRAVDDAAGAGQSQSPATEAVDDTTGSGQSQSTTTEAADVGGDRETTPGPGDETESVAGETTGTEPDSEPAERPAGTTTPDQPSATRTDPEEYPAAESETAEPQGTGYQESGSGESQAGSTSGTATDDSATPASLETRSIPSLDPERSTSNGDVPSEPTTTSEPEPGDTGSERDRTSRQEPSRSQPESGRVADLEAEVEERERRITDLESELRELSAENEELAAERDRLQGELEEARAEIRRLEERLDATDTGATGSVTLTAAEAIDGTNLFVRYDSKGEATLAKARDGSVDRDAVEANLRMEYHTQFDSEDAVVDGEEFGTFLQESIRYRFVDWLVRELLYEIRDTGHQNEMSVLYEALPKIDRAELNGKVSVVYTEDGKEHREQTQFDVVVRDRMGNPLVVANINDSREAATDAQMTDIVRTAERVGNSSGSLAAAFLVTSSFFEPEALETAEEATSSGLFSRDKRKSFVNLSRKDGYHLCLLEARNREFHLAIPEL